MAVYHEHDEPVVETRREVVRPDPVSGLTGYAFVKYAFILAITIVILYFIAKVVIPALG